MINCIILDNDQDNIDKISSLIDEIDEINLIGVFEKPVEAFNETLSSKIDVIIVEPNLPNFVGFDFIESLDKSIDVIVISRQQEYAIEAFELEVLDYIVKPFSNSRFLKSVSRIIKHRKALREKNKERTSIYIKVDKKMVKIYHDQILYVEAVGDYIKVVCKQRTYVSNSTLKNFTKELPKEDFLRIHRSYTISLKRVVSLEGNHVEIGENLIPIGRQYISETKSRIIE